MKGIDKYEDNNTKHTYEYVKEYETSELPHIIERKGWWGNDQYMLTRMFLYWTKSRIIQVCFVKIFIDYNPLAQYLQNKFRSKTIERTWYQDELPGYDKIDAKQTVSKAETKDLKLALYMIERANKDKLLSGEHNKQVNKFKKLLSNEYDSREINL